MFCSIGESPHTWTYTSADKHYHHTVNYYTDTTYYFINADAGITPKYIASEKDTGFTATDTVTSFDDYAYNELDASNLIQSGNLWFGQYFDVTTSYNIPFNFPNILTTAPAYVNAASSFTLRPVLWSQQCVHSKLRYKQCYYSLPYSIYRLLFLYLCRYGRG